ncbi:acid phosphatase [Mycobacterium sp.]|uniref:acid phosphatase n=1 Tax=Mycobacterium sp. TaxID=1785 RepID=UPI002CB64809|nr:acid phosphatase [Mycobacterium sp.]HME48547.1 acid phosphatase [Mycobacterium sp.]
MAIGTHRLVLLRHGETEWSLSGQHTSRTDLDLTEHGREEAKLVAEALARLHLDNPYVVSSPRKRAIVSAELAGLKIDEVTPLVAEWDYGIYEGLTTHDIRTKVPGWFLWTHGAEGGESLEQIGERADKAVAVALEHMESRDVVFVGHGHFSRAMIARWLELPVSAGARFAMPAASLAVCGFEYGLRQLAALGLTGYPHPAAYQ